MEEQRFISASDFLAVIPEIAAEGGISALAHRISASGINFPGIERRLRALVSGEQASIGVALADRILTALDKPQAFGDLVPDYVPDSTTICEDCGKEIEPGVLPIDLFRPEPTAMAGRVWNSTTRKWVRTKRARAGGRRFRPWHLCRFCRAEALRQRAHKRQQDTKLRTPPKRGGRPRLLSDDELRAAHELYMRIGISRRELARRLHAARKKGTFPGYEQSLLYGWRRLGLKMRSPAAQIAISRHGADTSWTPKEKKRRCRITLRNGRRCGQYVRRIDGHHLAEDGLCWNHRNHGREEWV